MTHSPEQMSEDFVPYADKIAKLLAEDENFVKLFGAYEELNDKIFKAESEIEPRSDFSLEGLKKRRLGLKDQIFSALTAK